MRELQIQSQAHPYAVREIDDLGAALDCLIASHRIFLLVDAAVWKIHGPAITSRLPADRVCVLEASETMKSYSSLEQVFCRILEAGFRRSEHLVVMGGGVLQDIGCFVASILFRGISWTLFPTTLLAQCDSCVGSKSSLNVGRFKNQLGTFYPPHEIFLYFPFLDTLSDQDIWSGLGEAIKLHLIKGEVEWTAIRQKLGPERPKPEVLRPIVWDCLRIKQPYVEKDEFDQGIRNLLNYGHTFAHAFESATRYAIPHGIAVTLGMLGATHFSRKLDWITADHAAELKSFLLPCTCGYASRLQPALLHPVLDAMKQDKKNGANGITFILTRGAGAMVKHQLPAETVSVWLEDFLLQGGGGGPA